MSAQSGSPDSKSATFLNLFESFSEELDFLELTPRSHKLLLAVSGGVDSVVLAHLFAFAGYKAVIAHVNFGLRGNESDQDEDFVKKLAESLNMEFDCLRLEDGLQRQPGESVQMAARRIRYNWFSELLKTRGLNYVVTGHHADDQIETFFINLMRGSGSKGLSGMSPISGTVVRPLLKFPRLEIMEAAASSGIPWRDDSSNSGDYYLRNRIRQQLIPVMNSLDPGFRQKLPETFMRLKRERSLLDFMLDGDFKTELNSYPTSLSITKEKLLRYPEPAFVLFELSRKYGFSYAICASACDNLTDTAEKQFTNGSATMVVERAVIRVNKGVSEENPNENNSISAFTFEELAEGPDFKEKLEASVAWLDAEKLGSDLFIKTWEKADFFYPSGMVGRKLLSDYFTDLKLSHREKSQQLLLVNGNDIVWVVNRRVDRRFAASSATRKFLRVSGNNKL